MQKPTKVVGRRVVARLIDVVLGALIFAVCWYIFSRHLNSDTTSGGGIVIGHTRYGFTGGDGGRRAATFILGGAGSLLISVILPGLTGKSPGKALLGIRIVKADGSRPGIPRAFLRELLMIIDGLFLYLVGLITALASSWNQRVGDMASGTYVVRGNAALAGLGGKAAPAAYNPAGTPPPPPAPPGPPPPPPPTA